MEHSLLSHSPIPFNRPYYTGDELSEIQKLLQSKCGLSGNGSVTKECQGILEKTLESPLALLTQSGTAALEMCAILCNLSSGDEVIMPSYTFVSTANAFVLQKATPVFVDIDINRVGICPKSIRAAITRRTRAICVVHYAGISCDMDEIMAIAKEHNLLVIEDAAHATFGKYNGRMLGSIGDFAALSFHETKNIQCGEGGALLVNNKEFITRAEIIWEKGTNRKQFLEGVSPKYSWVDVGSSFLPSELTAAALLPQLKKGKEITQRRRDIWMKYRNALLKLHIENKLILPQIPEDASEHCAHLFFFFTRCPADLREIVAEGKKRRVSLMQHYVPLHSSPYGSKGGRVSGSMANTDLAASTLLRLPLWYDMTDEMISNVVGVISDVLSTKSY